jgi:hypothetical protein
VQGQNVGIPYVLIKLETQWFDKATLLDVIRFTITQQLGEPPSIEEIEFAPNEEHFPVVWSVFHEKTPDVEYESFYRCGLNINGEWYRVAVEPRVYDQLPIAVGDVPYPFALDGPVPDPRIRSHHSGT